MDDLGTLKERNFDRALLHAIVNNIPFFPEAGDPVCQKVSELPVVPRGVTNGYQGVVSAGEDATRFLWELASRSEPRFGFSYFRDHAGLNAMMIWTKSD